MRTIYLDYNATTPLDPQVWEAMTPYCREVYGNPSSVHHVGRKARVALDESRERVAGVFGAKPSEVIFTSGGTEGNNLAIFGVARMLRGKGRRLVTTQIEHHSVLHCFEYLEKKEGFQVTYLPVSAEGRVDPAAVEKAITEETILVSVMAANNETGALQPVEEIGTICRAKGVLFHTDAAQYLGKQPFSSIQQFHANLVTVCGHKFHGPKGVGALYIESPLLPDPILFGGGHEHERRAGTENVAAIAGFANAVERFVKEPVFEVEKMERLSGELWRKIETIPGTALRGPEAGRLANTVSFTVEGCDSIALLAGLDLEGICASSGSACAAGSLEPSHVLIAMGAPKNLANSFVRFSFGRENTKEEAAFASEAILKVIGRIRGAR